MEIKEISAEGLQKEFHIFVAYSDIEKKIDEKLEEIAGKVKFPGFRAGHVPVKLVRQKYGKGATTEVLEEVLQSGAREVLEKKGLKAALPPKVDIVSFDAGKGLEYTIKAEVLPEVPQVDFASITLEKPVYAVSEADVDEGITNIIRSRKKFTPAAPSHKARKGDLVIMDFKGSVDGVLFEGGTAENFEIEIGSGQLIAGFEDQLIGAKEGDSLTVKATFPKAYLKKELADKPAEFAVMVKSVSVAEDVKVDDEFAKSLGFEGLDDLKKKVRQHIEEDFGGMTRSLLKKRLFDVLDEKVKFRVPQGMLDGEFEEIWQKLQQAKARGDASLQRPDAELRDEYIRICERRVRLGILLSEVGHRAEVKVSQEEMRKAIFKQAMMFPGQERKVFEFYQKHPEQAEALRGPLFEDKVVDFVLSKVKMKEKSVTKEELTGALEEQQQEGHVHDENCGHHHEHDHVHDENCNHDHEEAKPKKKAAAKKKTDKE
ncbi:MAG: trigger factor [Alphaproteobacteria bacterium]|nr:trigger factor [Alphaproteobacteria bacterium]